MAESVSSSISRRSALVAGASADCQPLSSSSTTRYATRSQSRSPAALAMSKMKLPPENQNEVPPQVRVLR